MGALAPPKATRPPAPPVAPPPRRVGRQLHVVEVRQRRANLHLFTYIVGSALFWVLWAAISISADAWYWWALVPIACWTLVLAVHLRHAYGLLGLGERSMKA